MLTTLIFFVAGIVLGLISLRLLGRWEGHGAAGRAPDEIFRHHS